MFVSSLPALIVTSVYTYMQDNWVQVSCFTQNRLALKYLGLSFIVYENNSILLVGSTEFEAIGSQPLLTIIVDSSGRAPSVPFGRVISNYAFFMANGSMNVYVGSYYETFHVNATIENGIVEYEIDLTDSVEKAKNAIYPEGTVEDCGIKGRMTFESMFDSSVGIINQKRFFRVLLLANANLDVITCDVTLPQTADLKDAKLGDQDVRKILPYRVDTSVGVTPMESTGANLYLEWNMPEEVSLLNKIFDNPIASSVINLIVGSILGSVFGRYVWAGISERRQKKQFAKKLMMELRGIKKDLQKHQPISTTIYDSSTSNLLLFSDETAGIVKKTYDEIKRKTIRVALADDEIKQLLQKINTAIDALRRE